MHCAAYTQLLRSFPLPAPMLVYFARSQYGTAIRISLSPPLRFLSYLLAFFSSSLAAANFFFTNYLDYRADPPSCHVSSQSTFSKMPKYLKCFSKYLRWRVIDRSANSIFSETSGSLILSFYDDDLFLKTRVADKVGTANSRNGERSLATDKYNGILYSQQCGLLTR